MQINWKSISTIALCVTSTAVFSQTGSTNYNWKAQSGNYFSFIESSLGKRGSQVQARV